jgi:ABC-2 type transport system ATP-binding protein
VDDLTFSLEAGTVTGFLGPNGAGKTTTLRVLLGLAEPTAGRALVFGRRYQELDQPARLAGAVLESNEFHPGRSGRDHCPAILAKTRTPLRRAHGSLPGTETWALGLVECPAIRSVRTAIPFEDGGSLRPSVRSPPLTPEWLTGHNG